MNKYGIYVPFLIYLLVGVSVILRSFDPNEMMWLRAVSFVGSIALFGLAIIELKKLKK